MAPRDIPNVPSLEFDRKRAKRLLEAARAGDPSAVSLFHAYHPRFGGERPDASSGTTSSGTASTGTASSGTASSGTTSTGAAALSDVALHDAELVVAREYGFSSWPRWKQFVEARLATRAEQAKMLVQAACSNDLRLASVLLDADPTLARFDLFTACVSGDVDTVRRALGENAALARSPGGPLGWRPIVYACFSRFLRRDPARAAGIVEIVRLLLAHRADPSSCYMTAATPNEASHRQTCLYAAAGIANHAELTRLLLEAGADIHEGAADGAGTEALYHASELEDTTCLRLLLEAKPRPELVSYCMGRVLDFDNEAGVLLYLSHGADPNFTVPWQQHQTHLHKAVCQRRSPATVFALLSHGADPNRADAHGISPYRHTVRRGHTELARLLEAHGALLASVTDEDRALGQIALGAATVADVGRAPDRALLPWAARREDLQLMTRLLDAGADIDAGHDMPPLHNACYAGRLASVRLLLGRGANLHQKNAYGGDALDSAIYGSVDCCDPQGGPGSLTLDEITHGDYGAIVELLLEAGAHLPKHASGSEAVREALRRHGVPDVD